MAFKQFFMVFLFLIPLAGYCHKGIITGVVKDPVSKLPLSGASVALEGVENKNTFTNEWGVYRFTSLDEGKYKVLISYIGYEKIILDAEVKSDKTTSIQPVILKTASLHLSEVTVNASRNNLGINGISALDIKLRPLQSSQEILRMVPGLFIAQHAGGGKAEQIFLRGFDIDHGTDINLTVDGMPVNMVSHAHGQGYSDLHFLIPELIEHIDFGKGPYYTRMGNFTTAGYVGFSTAKKVQNSVKIEAGSFGTYRNVNQLNLLGKKFRDKNHEAYIASEILASNGYFESSQDFRRFNLFGKYSGYLNDNAILTISIGNFYSKWNASGQIPERAVRAGLIKRYGSLDPTEGGTTGRRNININLVNDLPFGTLTSQAYFINYDFNLYSNFTFFLNDSLNGDQIRQRENRNIYGYKNTLSKVWELGGKEIITESGIGLRFDRIKDIQLSKSINRTFLGHKVWGDVNELNTNAYLESTVSLTNRLSINAGLRYDYFVFNYSDKMTKTNSGNTQKGIFSPKINFNYKISNDFNLYLKSGTGFHSNDTRVVVASKGNEILPRAYGADLGATFKPFDNLIFNTALWVLFLQEELVYVGDEGVVEPSGKTERLGIDLSIRHQLNKWLFTDVDLNLSKPRALTGEGKEYIPLAPTLTSTGGLTIKSKKNLSGSLRYRYMADRPANEHYSVTAHGYFLIDALVKYSVKNLDFTVSAENLLNQEWNEAQFDTESRLKNEVESVSEIHFTPGTPFFLKAGITLSIN